MPAKRNKHLKRLPNTLRVAAVQMRSVDDLEGNVAKIETILEECAEEGVKIAAFPECAVTGYETEAILRPTLRQLRQIEKRLAEACRRNRIHTLIGIPYRTGDKVYNAALIIDSKGKLLGRQFKIHLVGQDRAWNCVPGSKPSPIFQVGRAQCALFICHDSRYPELVRLPVLKGARVLFYLSHEASLKKEYKMDPYRAQVQARAVENSVYVVHANAPANEDLSGSHGQSRLVDPTGNLLKEASQFGEEILIADLDLRKATAEFAKGSLQEGPLADWWQAGLRQVRILK